MSKKSHEKSQRENQELRRQIEALKAQLKYSDKEVTVREIASTKPSAKVESKIEVAKAEHTEFQYNATYLKKDLLRTVILSVIIFGLIFGAYFSGRFS